MAELRMLVSKIKRICCSICHQVLRTPETLSCGHSFCTQCIQHHLDRDERKGRPCRCPECGLKFPCRPQLTRNTTVRRPAAAAGRKDSVLRGAQTRPRGTGTAGSGLCVRHGTPLEIYCCTDKQVICAVCAADEHMGHTIGSVTEERRRKQEEMKNIQTKSKQILQKQEEKWKNMGKTLEQIQEEARKTQDYCESILVGVIDSLQRHYMSVRELISGQEDEAAAQVHVSVQALQETMEEMKKRDAELDRLAQTDSDVLFLQEWPSLWSLCEKDHLHPPEVLEDPLLPFSLTKTAFEKLGKQLEAFCNREFASISETIADSGEQQESGGESEDVDMQQTSEATISQSPGFSEHNMEPKTRAEFLQYACVLSLDPTTAHEDLVISAGDTEVRLKPPSSKSAAVRYPERFLHRRQVLCREGLQAERCYYEIEVEGDKAEIALAYKKMDRRSRSRLSAFGGNRNSWSLDRSINYSVSHRADSVQLTTHPSHCRLGVYLKFKEGTLSFYEVSDTMTFLYEIEGDFTEPLYPGFWLGEKCCIRICDMRRH